MMMFLTERKSHVCLSMIDDLNTLKTSYKIFSQSHCRMLVGPLHLLSGGGRFHQKLGAKSSQRCQEKFTPKIHPKILPKENRQRASKQKKTCAELFLPNDYFVIFRASQM